MGDSTIDSELIVLINPFCNSLVRSEPRDSLTLGTSDQHNISAPDEYRVGDVIQVYNTGTTGKAGYAQFVYLQAVQNTDVAFAARQVCHPDSATVWYQFTNDPDDGCVATGGALFAVCISVMTTLYYGWFWCGGICPEESVADLGGNYATNGDVVAGNITPHKLAADAIGWGPKATTESAAGYALADDA